MLASPNCHLLYPFENQANDYSGNARHGTVTGSGVYATRPNGGRCLYFDGDDYVKTPSFGLSGTVLWFAADVRCKQQAGVYQGFIGDGAWSTTVGHIVICREINSDAIRVECAAGGTMAVVLAANFFTSPFEDAWLHMIVVIDYPGKLCYFYRQGVLFFTSSAMTGTPLFPSTDRVKYVGSLRVHAAHPLTDGYMANVQLGTFATMPPVAQVTANAQRMHLGLHPIW
jgi:hypothetical protein